MELANARYVDAGQSLYDITVTAEGETFDYTVAADDPAPMAVAIREKVATDEIVINAHVVDLPAIKTRLKAAIDAAAEAERLKYVTAGAGQSMTYQEKAAEAARFTDDPAPDPVDYPMLAAEIGITAATLADVAAVVAANRAAWRTIGAAIEGTRLGAKAAIEAAETVEDAESAAQIGWPQP
ncbi:hypothetical protein [Aurantimonas coralicida]|uniref:hypothetical protein n=1 Tax=Aurantimonas coralicida TaxID=182270 RepID=UPI001E4DC132|nr:hypothetical protein [Aurantimonas coralicida]MCD1645232.1 hypothetical protein [Aurantimonas coralicida]